MSQDKPIRRIAIIGTGVIGASWSALYLAKGLQVVATDVAPNAEAGLRKFVETAWPALKRLGLAPGASQSNLKFTAALPAAVWLPGRLFACALTSTAIYTAPFTSGISVRWRVEARRTSRGSSNWPSASRLMPIW
jgi:hypothetical protein